MTISMDKKYRTRDGHEVRIYAVDGNRDFPIHGAIKFASGWKSSCWTADGSYLIAENNLNDLIKVKPRIQREFWVNLYPELGSGHYESKICAVGHYETKVIADFEAMGHRIACVKVVIDCEEGEGL